MPSGERREWIKPIMFSGGIGNLDASHVDKHVSDRVRRRDRRGRSSEMLRRSCCQITCPQQCPEKGMLVVKIGGPAYR